MSTARQATIRLQLGTASNPPVFPFDRITGLAPQIWRGETVAFELGIFAPGGAAVDLSNVDFLEVDIFPLPVLNQRIDTNFTYNPYSKQPFPNQTPAPQAFVTVPRADITPLVSKLAWQNGTSQQARAIFDWTQTAGLDLGGRDMLTFWLAVHGITAEGRKIVYGGTRLEVFESGAQGIYLPNNLAPLDVPAATILYIPPNQQMPFALPISVEGTIQIDGTMIQV